VIIRENVIEVPGGELAETLVSEDVECKPQEIIFFDLEHYVYRKPKCIGVFGACVYNNKDSRLYVTQYMIENKSEVVDILLLAKKYFMRMKKLDRKVIVTFSGNNDFTVIKYLFNKYNIHLDFSSEFETIDLQKEYERVKKTSIGLKNLEKEFNIYREGELISGSNLAKTFHKVLKDKEYIERMPKDKIENILLYNEQDVVNLYKIFVSWYKFIKVVKEETEIEDEEDESVE
jgi:uncharacterized protein YprB with RNaseH-like and TPR domain